MWLTEKPPREKPQQPSTRVVKKTPLPTEPAPAEGGREERRRRGGM